MRLGLRLRLCATYFVGTGGGVFASPLCLTSALNMHDTLQASISVLVATCGQANITELLWSVALRVSPPTSVLCAPTLTPNALHAPTPTLCVHPQLHYCRHSTHSACTGNLPYITLSVRITFTIRFTDHTRCGYHVSKPSDRNRAHTHTYTYNYLSTYVDQ